MKIDKARHIIFSPCGGTEKVLEAMGRGIPAPTAKHNVTLPGNRTDNLSFAQSDLAFFGFPVYGGRVPRNTADIFAKFTGDGTPCALVTVYGNRAWEGALLDLHAAASSRGFKPVAAVAAIAEHSSSPQIAAGRPDGDDRKLLAEFGLRILRRAEEGSPAIEAPGAYPDWGTPSKIDLFPRTDSERCTRCARCAQVCPNGAIAKRDPVRTDTQRCIVCGACVKYCPEKARTLGTPEVREMLKPHLLDAVARKEPELFL